MFVELQQLNAPQKLRCALLLREGARVLSHPRLHQAVRGTGAEVALPQEVEQAVHSGVRSAKAQQQHKVFDATYVELRKELFTEDLHPPVLSEEKLKVKE